MAHIRTLQIIQLKEGIDAEIAKWSSGSPAWIRTKIHGVKGRCPTIRRPGKEVNLTLSILQPSIAILQFIKTLLR